MTEKLTKATVSLRIYFEGEVEKSKVQELLEKLLYDRPNIKYDSDEIELTECRKIR